MKEKNRSSRARELCGLSVGQAARLLDTTAPADLRAVEELDEVPPEWVDRLCELYRVLPEWLRGEVEQRDYGAIRTFARADLGKLEWDLSIVEEAHAAQLAASS